MFCLIGENIGQKSINGGNPFMTSVVILRCVGIKINIQPVYVYSDASHVLWTFLNMINVFIS